MRQQHVYSSFAIVAAIGCFATALSQGGGLGGLGGGGFGGGGQQGQIGQMYDRSVAALERAISTYLDGNEVKNILTPGEYSEWKLNLKSGQVVIAEARSEAFDPALEVVDGAEKILHTNDDRYPGDQRPLVLWRCEKDGPYALRARCFRDKSGGQFFIRVRVYDSLDVGDQDAERDFEPNERFLLRIPMRAGQIRRVFAEVPDNRFQGVHLGRAISPIGLPDIELAARVGNAVGNAIAAPVDGDYYVLSWGTGGRRARVRIVSRELRPKAFEADRTTQSGKAERNTPALWSVSVTKGQFLEMAAPELSLGARLIAAEAPDFSKYDLKKDEANPFFPKAADEDEGPALQMLSARARDSRVATFVCLRDTKLWLASNGAAPTNGEYTLRLTPASLEFTAAEGAPGKLRIGRTDYWSFEGNAGDVMTFKASAEGFSHEIVVRDPDLRPVWSTSADPDQTTSEWNMIIRRPGRYLVSMNAFGEGASGTYRLDRKVYNARAFSKGSPAQGNFSTGEAEVWKFTAKPNEPLLIRWSSPRWMYSISVCDENGNPSGLPLTQIDKTTQYGILKVDQPRTFVIVLVARGLGEDYKIELMDLPGSGK